MSDQLGNFVPSTVLYTAAEVDTELQNSGKFSTTSAGVNAKTASLTPALASYVTNARFFLTFTSANTGACTLNINGLGAIALTKNGATALVSGDIVAGQAYAVLYDGTQFQLVGRHITDTDTGITQLTGDVTAGPGSGSQAATIPANTVTNAKAAQMAANTVKVNNTAGLANASDLAVASNTVLGRVGGNIVAAQLVNAQIANNTIANGKLATMPTNTLKGNNTGGDATPADLTVAQIKTLLGAGAASGLATLDAGSKIPVAQLPTDATNNFVTANLSATANRTHALADKRITFSSTGDANLFVLSGQAVYSRVGIGGNPTGKFSIFSTIDETVMNIKAHTTQNNPMFNIQDNAGVQAFSMYSSGLINAYKNIRFNINTALDTISFEKSGVPMLKCHSTNMNTTIGSSAVPTASTSLLLSQTDRAMVINKVSGTTADGLTPVEGMMLYCTNATGTTVNSEGFWGYSNSAWKKFDMT